MAEIEGLGRLKRFFSAPVAQVVLASAASVASGLGLTQVSNSISLAVASVATAVTAGWALGLRKG